MIPIYCDKWLPPPLIIIITPSFNAALHQAPDGSGWVREEGRWNSQVCFTWREWSLITAAVKRRGRLSSGDRSLSRACTLVSSWVQEGSVEGYHAARAAGPAVRTRTAPTIRLTGQDAGPYNPRKRRGPKEDEAAKGSRRLSCPGPERGARGRSPPLTWTLPSWTLTLLHKPRSTTRTPDPLFILDTFPLWTLYFIIYIK